MIVISRFVVPSAHDQFRDAIATALAALSRMPGYREGSVAQAADDPTLWVMLTTWDGAGSYRRALGGFDVRMALMPLAPAMVDEPSAFEAVAVASGGLVTRLSTDRAGDAATAHPGAPLGN